MRYYGATPGATLWALKASPDGTAGSSSLQGGGAASAPRLKQRTMDASLICPLSLSDSLDRFKGLKPTVILLSRGISDAESSWRAGQGWQRKGRLRSVVWARTKPPPSE